MLAQSCFCGSDGTPVGLTWLGTTAWISFVDCVLNEIALSACSIDMIKMLYISSENSMLALTAFCLACKQESVHTLHGGSQGKMSPAC